MKLDENTKELAALDKRVAELKIGFAKRTAEAETLRQALQRTEDTLSKAQALLGQLSGEKTRWDKQVTEMRRAIATLPSQMMLAAGFSTYLAKTPEVRGPCTRAWREPVLALCSPRVLLRFVDDDDAVNTHGAARRTCA